MREAPVDEMAARAPIERKRATLWLAALAVLGAWSILPPYVGPPLGLKLDTATRLEVADHVVPGVIVFASATMAAIAVRRGRAMTESLLVLGAIGVSVLGGIWETATHVPLLFQGGESNAPWGAVLLHSTAGPAVLALSLPLLVRAAAPDVDRRPRA
jgi:hypothetical protein